MTDEAREYGKCLQRAYFWMARALGVGDPPYSDEDLERMAFDPDEITALAGLQPTRAWRRGDADPGRRARRFSEWQFELPEADTYYTEEVVTALLDAVEPFSAGILDACAELGMEAGVMVVIKMYGHTSTPSSAPDVVTPAIIYSGSTLSRPAALHLSISHDQYALLP